MIIRWKRRSATEYVAKWQEIDFLLEYIPVESRWATTIDGARCKQRWHTCTTAMEVIDAALSKEIVKLGAEVAAKQGKPSALHIVHRTEARHVAIA